MTSTLLGTPLLIPFGSLVLKTWRRVCIPSGFCPTLHHLSALVDTDNIICRSYSRSAQ